MTRCRRRWRNNLCRTIAFACTRVSVEGDQLSRYTICAMLIAALVGCGGSQPTIGALGAMPQGR